MHDLLCAGAASSRPLTTIVGSGSRSRGSIVIGWVVVSVSPLLLLLLLSIICVLAVTLVVILTDHIANYIGSFLILRQHELLQNRLELRFLDQISQLEVVLAAAFQSCRCVICVLNELATPATRLRLGCLTASVVRIRNYCAHGHVQCSCSLVRRWILVHLTV